MQLTPNQAVAIIVSHATMPPQIDYVSPSDKYKLRLAEEVINNLPDIDRRMYSKRIETQINNYFEPNIKGLDGNYYSVAQLDAMF